MGLCLVRQALRVKSWALASASSLGAARCAACHTSAPLMRRRGCAGHRNPHLGHPGAFAQEPAVAPVLPVPRLLVLLVLPAWPVPPGLPVPRRCRSRPCCRCCGAAWPRHWPDGVGAVTPAKSPAPGHPRASSGRERLGRRPLAHHVVELSPCRLAARRAHGHSGSARRPYAGLWVRPRLPARGEICWPTVAWTTFRLRAAWAPRLQAAWRPDSADAARATSRVWARLLLRSHRRDQTTSRRGV